MPYAVQFYGNFFIHGWPYDRFGRALAPGPSGGCIRMNTADARIIFEFAERGMPVLVFEEKEVLPLPALLPLDEMVSAPDVKSRNFLVADLDTGEIVLSKGANSEIYAGPAVRAMMALSASEIVNLEKRIAARSWMFEGAREGIIIPGRYYRGHDLLYPLLLRSSREAAMVLARFFTPEYFVAAMNAKARAIGMKNTFFADITGDSQESGTTLYDLAKMMRYTKEYRGFILGITRELRGPGETILAVPEMNTPDGKKRTIFIALANSEDIEKDFEATLIWLKENLGLN